jgi:hypothetical protein
MDYDTIYTDDGEIVLAEVDVAIRDQWPIGKVNDFQMRKNLGLLTDALDQKLNVSGYQIQEFGNEQGGRMLPQVDPEKGIEKKKAIARYQYTLVESNQTTTHTYTPKSTDATTDDISEGSTNLYFTENRVESAINGGVQIPTSALTTSDISDGELGRWYDTSTNELVLSYNDGGTIREYRMSEN